MKTPSRLGARCSSTRSSGALEFELAERIVSVLWRLRRVPQFEAALLTFLEEEARQQNASKARNAAEWRKNYRTICHKPAPQEVGPALVSPQILRGQSLAVLLTSDFSGKLSRYEASLQKQLSALLEQLRNKQELRLE